MPERRSPWSMRDRVTAVLQGRLPDRWPFVTRLEVWYRAHARTGTLPPEFDDRSLLQVHADLGIGQLRFVAPYAYRLRAVEVVAEREGRQVYRAYEPVVENFPGLWDIIAVDQPGTTATTIRTPRGRLHLTHEVLPETVHAGADPYLREHLIKGPEDLPAAEFILENAELVPRWDSVREEMAAIGDLGFVVPLLQRIPFQQLLLEYLGERQLFFALHDDPGLVKRLLALLDEQLLAAMNRLPELDVAYVEFPDNLHGLMTNPRLFASYCLPFYQRYTETLHKQGKKVGCHADGDVRTLLGLLCESGLDVAESFSPAPLTACSFEEAWQAWSAGPIIWGGIPSPWLESRTPQADFEAAVRGLLDRVGSRPIIFGIVDVFMRHNSIERARTIAGLIESHPLA